MNSFKEKANAITIGRNNFLKETIKRADIPLMLLRVRGWNIIDHFSGS
jgi:hypothetical protein